METQKLDYKLWLQRELTRRCNANPRYSLRAFARFLKTDPSTVSQILSGKRTISPKLLDRLIKTLDPDLETKESLLNFIHVESSDGLKETLPPSKENFHLLAQDVFSVMAEWYHYAILEIPFIRGFKSDVNFISKALGITPTEAKLAIERLKRLDLLREVRGKLLKNSGPLTNYTVGSTNSALKSLQKHVLEKALRAIDECHPEEKDITSMTMAIDENKMEDARKIIKKFRREMCQFLEDGNQSRIYHLGVQLYPVSKRIKKGEIHE